MADEVLLLDIYPAGEQAIQGISSFHLAEKVNNQHQNKVKLVGNSDIENLLDQVVQDGDAILMQGAGSIGQMAYQLIQKKIGAL
jgi:UDP-N-acetylmuramate--alanine ligase